MTTGSNDPGASFGLPTDRIVSAFEEKLKQSILTKTLVAAQDKQPLKLTDEEYAYLAKQAVENSPVASMKVETVSPTITLRKGNTELNIKNAATILQKMEEKYPTPKNPPPSSPIYNQYVADHTVGDSVTGEEIDEIIDELEKEIEEPGSSKRVHISSKPEIKEGDEKCQQSMVEKFKRCVNFPHSKIRPETAAAVMGEEAVSKVQPINTVNRNAYEIREGVLAMALDFVKWQTDMNLVVAKESGGMMRTTDVPKSDTILDVAKKFYTFVENKR